MMTDAGDTAQAADAAIRTATEALNKLRAAQPDLAGTIAGLVAAVANEATRTARFATALSAAAAAPVREAKPKRTGRRAAGVIDPFAVYGETGASGLRGRLAQLNLEELRDIVAEHGLDHDRLAMKWKDAGRVIDRIVDKVTTRAAKGSAFRPGPAERSTRFPGSAVPASEQEDDYGR